MQRMPISSFTADTLEGVQMLHRTILRDMSHEDSSLLPCSTNKKLRTHVYCCLRGSGGVWWSARNSEISAPCGTQCAERNVIAEYVSRGGRLCDVTTLLLTSFLEGGVEGWVNNFILPCGVCREELCKVTVMAPHLTVWCLGEWKVSPLCQDPFVGYAKGPVSPKSLLPGVPELVN